MKKLLLALLIASQGCIASQINIDKADANNHESTVTIESVGNGVVKTEVSYVSNDSQRRFDALDGFVDTLNYTTASINIVDLWFSTAFIAGKFLYHEPHWFPGYEKYLVLGVATLGATGILELGSYVRYYVYRFVRSGVETIAPSKMVKAFNDKMCYLEARFPCLTSGVGMACALISFFVSGSQERNAAISITVDLLRPFFKTNLV